ncbi:hypothetical protein IFO69_14840 [Echinicola sp. CAU 1574]|uniref:Uncharacterized protein n=1 Tax=Echinicola arenosa TaxID=2774144 RepID=A0ABR9AMK8_9BACT|nr:hypothetical protein [Echinicola arenosa]MBD8490031.1 hypothetical protein [Echinicola arenosa]
MNPYGSYAELMTVSERVVIGEALAVSEDTLLILGAVNVEKVSLKHIKQVKFIITRNAADKYLKATAILTIPALIGIVAHSDYSGEFAALGLVTLGTGGLATLIESGRKGEIKTYPGEIIDLSTISEYCRFPQGLPSGIDVESLKGHLIK